MEITWEELMYDFFFWQLWDLIQSLRLARQAPYHLSHSVRCFLCWICCTGWPQAGILQISASQIDRITCVSSWDQANM
jgi:hypothetical protein